MPYNTTLGLGLCSKLRAERWRSTFSHIFPEFRPNWPCKNHGWKRPHEKNEDVGGSEKTRMHMDDLAAQTDDHGMIREVKKSIKTY